MKVIDVINELHTILGDNMDKWLFTPNKAFENKTPIKIIADGQIDRIHRMIEQINNGVAN